MGGGKRKYEELVEEGRGPKIQESQDLRVPRSQHPKDPWSQGPKDPWSQDQDISVIFKYELDSKEGQSCLHGCKPKISPTVILLENLSLRGE